MLDGATDIEAQAVLVATGVSYRRFEAPGHDGVVGRGVHYGASEASQTNCEDVYVVGAANSAASRRIVVEPHGGEIDVAPRPGDSVIRVRLPRGPSH